MSLEPFKSGISPTHQYYYDPIVHIHTTKWVKTHNEANKSSIVSFLLAVDPTFVVKHQTPSYSRRNNNTVSSWRYTDQVNI